MKDDAWFAGFTDGEGCFVLGEASHGGVQPQFRMGLRADDVAVLRALQREFGGSIYVRELPNPRHAPVADWTVASKADLAGLVEYFDRFPLRAKKRQDYLIWREGVRAYVREGRQAGELAGLRAALAEQRGYDAPVIELPQRNQLRLVDNL